MQEIWLCTIHHGKHILMCHYSCLVLSFLSYSVFEELSNHCRIVAAEVKLREDVTDELSELKSELKAVSLVFKILTIMHAGTLHGSTF